MFPKVSSRMQHHTRGCSPQRTAVNPTRSMFVSMMDVGEVVMAVRHRQMPVLMIVRLVAGPAGIVRVLVMRVVAVAVGVFQVVVSVLMAVLLGEMQPDADAHQGGGSPE